MADTTQAISALKTLASLLFTSSAFRFILSDVLLTARQALADVAVDVSKVASIVQNSAAQVEEVVRPPPGTGGIEGLDDFDVELIKDKGKSVAGRVGDLADETARETRRREARSWTVVAESPDRVKEAFLERVKNVGFSLLIEFRD